MSGTTSTVLRATVLRATALLALAALGTGCQASPDNTAAPAGTPTATTAGSPTGTASPAASASSLAVTAANTAQVCTAVDQVIIAGSRKIAADSAAATKRDLSPEQLNDQLKRNLAGMADDVREQAARAQDPEIRALIVDTANRIDAGTRAGSPATWLGATFTGIPARLTRECRG
ncbi:hypothetical protein JNW88_28385 [Micromonospora sp. ATA32]|nr:hypothetical protein [Micromonospora sp. ATA32]